jgi:hypothetical protein
VAARTVLNRRAMRFNATHATGVFVIVWLIPGFQHRAITARRCPLAFSVFF